MQSVKVDRNMLNAWIFDRKVEHYSDFALRDLETIKKHIDIITAKHPAVVMIYVAGSRINGTYRTGLFNEYYKEWREQANLRCKTKQSDWDYFTVPTFTGRIGEIDLLAVNPRRMVLVYKHKPLF